MIEKIPFFLIYFLSFLLALSFHEAAHAYVASRFGDDTARRLGRVTLNPIAHMDFVGTFLLPTLLFFTGLPVPIGGWGKPVPVNSYNLRHPRQDGLWIAFAGPASNLILAALAAVSLRGLFGAAEVGWLDQSTSVPFFESGLVFLATFLRLSVFVNLGLAFFNLIPLHPLDGGKVMEGLLPESLLFEFRKIAQYGFLIIFALYYLGAFRLLYQLVRLVAGLLVPGI